MNLEIPKKLNIGLAPQISGSRSFIIEIVLLIVVCGLFVWFLILPKKSALNAEKEVLDTYKTEQEKISANLDIVNKLVSELKTHTADIAKLDEAMPLEGKSTYLQLLIQKLADSAGVAVADVNVSTVEGVVAGNTTLLQDPYGASRSVQKLDGSVYISGPFIQAVNFLKKVETSGRVINVKDVEVQAIADGGVSMKLSFEAYYLAP